MEIKILQEGDAEGTGCDRTLREIAQEVIDIDSQEIQTLIQDLIGITKSVSGVGISAPQIGISRRVIVVASHPNRRYPYAPEVPPFAMINPKITAYSPELVIAEEGCLSVKQKRGNVSRHREIEVEYFDSNAKIQKKQYSNFIARIIQHEIDHLNGILFIDHIEENSLKLVNF